MKHILTLFHQMYSQWMDTQNYMEGTSRVYGRMMNFPLSSLFLSWRYRTTQRALMKGAPPETTLEQLGIEVGQERERVCLKSCDSHVMQLQARAEEGINLLSSRLGDKQFFNGE